MFRKLIALAALAVAFLASPVLAQTALTPPAVTYGSTTQQPSPVTIVSYDSVSGLPCIFGSTATCGAPSNNYKNITTGTTTAVKSGPGILAALTINAPVASATITIYDNTAASGTKIATITLPSTITSDTPVTLNYNVAFATGLTIVTSGSTDLTISYR